MREETVTGALDAVTEKAMRSDAPLWARLHAVATRVREIAPDFAAIVDRQVARLASAEVGALAPRPGDPMPPFALPDQAGHVRRLEDFLARGPLVIAFHRGHWCPYCQLHVDALARAAPEFTALGASVVSISPETGAWSARLAERGHAAFPLLTDMDGAYALELGLLFWVGEEAMRAMAAAGLDLDRYQGNDAWMLPVPATYVVGSDGIIRARHVDPDYRLRMAIEDVIAAVKSCGGASMAP